MANIDLGGERRNNKAKRLLMRFWEKPTESVARASHGWTETMGAYRLENDAFERHDIMKPHWQRTRERMSEGPVVLCIQVRLSWISTMSYCQIWS
ncbi:MAG: transposase DNA-binding-containing protein [Burkholderia sp.]